MRMLEKVVAIASLLASATAASAATLSADQILNQFNTVIFGDHTLASQVHGRAFVGGNLVGGSGSMTTTNYPVPASTFADVTIVGDARTSFNTRAGATVDIGGVRAPGVNINNASTVRTGVAGLGQVRDDFRSTLIDASERIEDMTANATMSNFNSGQGWRFGGLSGQITVFDIAATDLNRNEIDVSLNGASAILINVSGTDINLSKNFNSDENLGNRIIWNFYEATSLHLNNRWVGSVLAPLATVSNNNNIHGTLVAAAFRQGGQVHQQSWLGDLPEPPAPAPAPAPVPLPAAGWLLLAALGAVGTLRRRA